MLLQMPLETESLKNLKVDYNDVRPKFKSIEMEQDEKNYQQPRLRKHYYILKESKRYHSISE